MTKILNHLPISEEALGAYLEGKLSVQDSNFIEEMLEDYPEFKTFVDDIQVYDINEEESIYDYYPDFDSEFCLPDVPAFSDNNDDIQLSSTDEDIELQGHIELGEDIEVEEGFVSEDGYSGSYEDTYDMAANDNMDLPADDLSFEVNDGEFHTD